MTIIHAVQVALHSENAALNIASTSKQHSAQKENPAQQIIRQAVENLQEQLLAGKSEALTAYLAAMARFHRYSFGNILAIAQQRPTATHVAGFHTWKSLGRLVKKGERGIRILAPMVGNRRRKDGRKEDASLQHTKAAPVLIGFRAVYVFDVSQTEGQDLPDFTHAVTGVVGNNRARLMDFLEGQNIELAYSEDIAPALGVSHGGKITLLPGQSPAEEFVTLVHEAGHELLHKSERRASTSKTARETEAEAMAFIVGQAIGLEMGQTSSDYIQMYAGDAALLAESLGDIQHASALILGALLVENCGETK
jgi:hypothetical protein